MKNYMSKNEFLRLASIKFGQKYDYSFVEYKNKSTKIKIICPEHGAFHQRPKDHLRSNGCNICSGWTKLNTESFINKAKLKHGNTYSYSSTNYAGSLVKVKIICKVHGVFEQLPHSHIKAGHGCSKCASIKGSLVQIAKAKREFTSKAICVHGNKYDYSKSNYIKSSINIKILCKRCGNLFNQTPQNHLSGSGCSICNKYGYKKSQFLSYCENKDHADPKVYIIRCFNDNENFIKIGLTADAVSKRFKTKTLMPYSYEILKEIKGSPDFIWSLEKDLHKKYRSFKYKPQISFAGETECFNQSILQSSYF